MMQGEEEQDLISVIVPVYNVEKYLDRCVESLLGQTYRSLEIILVDDDIGRAHVLTPDTQCNLV